MSELYRRPSHAQADSTVGRDDGNKTAQRAAHLLAVVAFFPRTVSLATLPTSLAVPPKTDV